MNVRQVALRKLEYSVKVIHSFALQTVFQTAVKLWKVCGRAFILLTFKII